MVNLLLPQSSDLLRVSSDHHLPHFPAGIQRLATLSLQANSVFLFLHLMIWSNEMDCILYHRLLLKHCIGKKNWPRYSYNFFLFWGICVSVGHGVDEATSRMHACCHFSRLSHPAACIIALVWTGLSMTTAIRCHYGGWPQCHLRRWHSYAANTVGWWQQGYDDSSCCIGYWFNGL